MVRRALPGTAIAVLVFVALALAMFSNLYVYDSVGPVAELLSRQLGFSDTQIGALNAVYSLPNIVLVLLGGIWIDRIGAAAVILRTGLVCLAGACLTAISSTFVVMVLGRLLFGIGAETLIIAVLVALARWFSERHLALTLTLAVSVGRVGSYLADRSASFAGALYQHGWREPLLLAAGVALLGFLGCTAFFWLDLQAMRRRALPDPNATEPIHWRALPRFPARYWYVVGLCVAFYGVVYPFRSTFAIKYFQHTRALSLAEASRLNSDVYMAAIVAMPLFGGLMDRLRSYGPLLIIGAFALPLSFYLLSQNHIDLWVPTALLGLSVSIVPSVLWPAVASDVPDAHRGSAFGLMTSLQSVGLVLGNMVVGGLNQHEGASAAHPEGYAAMLWFFGAGSLVGCGCAVALVLLRRPYQTWRSLS